MKKNYITPSMKIVNAEVQLLQVVSADGIGWGGKDNGYTPESRQNSLWDDDDDF